MKRLRDIENAWLRPEDCFSQERFQPCLTNPDENRYWSKVAEVSWLLTKHPRASGIRLHEIVCLSLAHAGIVPTAKRLSAESLRYWWTSLARPSFLERPALQSFEEPDWIRQLLLGRHHDHPLRWAILSSAIMTPKALEGALNDATPRQLTLDGRWESALNTRVDLLKPSVWAMLLAGERLSGVSVKSGIPTTNLRQALRLNPVKQKIRAERLADARKEDRRGRITQYLLNNPKAGRAELLLAHSADLRWLELHDTDWISQQIRHRHSRRFRQASFDF